VNAELDRRVRLAAFAFLEDLEGRVGEVMPRDALVAGFTFEGRRVSLMSPQGIFTPAILEVPLSLTTVPIVAGKERPYEDEISDEGISYRYRGTDPNHRDNAGVRLAMIRHLPLIYFHGILPGHYQAEWPAYVVYDDRAALTFSVLIDDRVSFATAAGRVSEDNREGARRYITASVQKRLHQRTFRQRVIAAYREHCAICRLRHQELLEAAHILPDGHPRGVPSIPNGIALCKLHHAAFDAHIIGVTPDYQIEVREDILAEKDGPMLLHGLQGFHGAVLTTPRSELLKPSRDFLAERYNLFRRSVY
jgi:putative restriction endonuclease